MKKVIFALAAVVALAACSQEDVIVADKGDAIGFDTFVGKATRVDDPSLTKGNLANFAVYGAVTNNNATAALIFDNVEVVGSDLVQGAGYSTWTYQGTQYWIAGADYDFAAVAPAARGKKGAFNVTTKKTTLSFTNDGVTDLLYAQTTAEGKAEGNTAVGFDFRHVLSKVKFSFENQYLSTGSTIAVRNIKLTNAHQTATATLNANTDWALDNVTFAIPFGDAETVNDDNLEIIAQGLELESYNARFIIPSADDYTYVVSFDVDIVYGSTVVETYSHTANVTFAPAAGTAYDIKTVINHENIDPEQKQEPIEFTVNTMADWGAYNEDETATINPAQNN